MTEAKNKFVEWCQQRTAEVERVLNAVDTGATEKLIALIDDAAKVFVTGQGRTGLVARCFAMRLMQMGFEVHVTGETTCPPIGTEDVLLAFSCSGETATTLQMAKTALESGAEVAGVTGEECSTLTRNASHVVLLSPQEAGNSTDGGAFPGNTLFEEAALFYCDALIELLMHRGDVPAERLRRMHANLE